MRVIYIDKEVHNLHSFIASFRVHKEFSIHACITEEEIIGKIEKEYIDVLIIDQTDANEVGIEFLQRSKVLNAELLKIIVTGHKEVSLLENACNEGKIFSYYQKPFDWEQIIDLLLNRIRK